MIVYPAIDLKDGECVRLYQGDMEQATVFSDNPAGQAMTFKEQGAEWLHVVDLNGAFEGKPVNTKALVAIRNAVDIPIQIGGGIRTLSMIEGWLRLNLDRVVLGTVAIEKPELIKEACEEFPDKVAVSIDAKDGKVAVEGWAKTSDVDALDMAKQMADIGVSALIYTNIARDGTKEGPDIEGTKAMAEAVSVPVIASGGIATLDDLKAIKGLESSGVAGAITGRALYDGSFTLQEAVAQLQ